MSPVQVAEGRLKAGFLRVGNADEPGSVLITLVNASLRVGFFLLAVLAVLARDPVVLACFNKIKSLHIPKIPLDLSHLVDLSNRCLQFLFL